MIITGIIKDALPPEANRFRRRSIAGRLLTMRHREDHPGLANPRWLRLVLSALLLVALWAMEDAGGVFAASAAAGTGSDFSRQWIMGLYSHDWEADFFTLAPQSERPYMSHPHVNVVWQKVEPEKGKFTWDALDRAMQLLLDNGSTDFLFTLDKFLPAWAGPQLGPPNNLDDWRAFVRAVAQRYGKYVDYYEIWNEPSFDVNSPAAKQHGAVHFGGNFLTDYPPILKAAYEEIKAVDPRSMVICGSLNDATTPVPENGVTYYRTLTDSAHRIQDYCDAFGLHPYYNPPDWGRFYDAVQQVMAENGVRKELVVTEVGWLHNIDNGLEIQRQAIGMVGVGSLVERGCRKFWIYQDLDDPPGQTFDFDYGLLDYQGNPHPAWNSFKAWVLAFNFFDLPFPPL